MTREENLQATLEQRLHALVLANEVRTHRARVKRELTGPLDAVAVLLDPHPLVAGMKVVDLLDAIPKYGASRVLDLRRRVGFSDAKTIGGLSPRQRDELVAALRLNAARVAR